jgi:hypothetical protein
MIQYFTLQKSLRKVTEQKLEVCLTSFVVGLLQLTETLKDTQDTLRKTKQAAERAAVASRQQVVILKRAQEEQVSFTLASSPSYFPI